MASWALYYVYFCTETVLVGRKKKRHSCKIFLSFPHIVLFRSIRTPQIMTICSYFTSEPDLLFFLIRPQIHSRSPCLLPRLPSLLLQVTKPLSELVISVYWERYFIADVLPEAFELSFCWFLPVFCCATSSDLRSAENELSNWVLLYLPLGPVLLPVWH